MTEAEWAAATEPGVMLAFLRDRTTYRKLRMFAVASYYLDPNLLDEANRYRVEVAARYADGLATESELQANWSFGSRGRWTLPELPFHWALMVSGCFVGNEESCDRVEDAALSHILRDIIGNPFRSVVFDPSWHTDTARSLAEAAYEDRAWDRLPILADALEDAGCEDEAVLNHLRGPGPHCRGCWVVDLVLGKS
ncbi:hypothetical protein [Limnoglobus roseus]|nr:hypothetical protein [Limnoglobus roseus]